MRRAEQNEQSRPEQSKSWPKEPSPRTEYKSQYILTYSHTPNIYFLNVKHMATFRLLRLVDFV